MDLVIKELHDRDNDYFYAPEMMTIKPEITGEKKHNLRALYLGAKCPHSRKYNCSFFLKKHYLLLKQLFCFYLKRKMNLVEVHREIRFKLSPYIAVYIATNTRKHKQFTRDNVKKAF